MNQEHKQRMSEALTDFYTRMGPHWDYREETRYGTRIAGTVPSPSGAAKVCLYFPWDEPLCQFRLHFMTHISQYRAKKHDLRSVLMEIIHSMLESVCKGPERTQLLTGADPEAKTPVFAEPAQPFEPGAYLNQGGHLVKERAS